MEGNWVYQPHSRKGPIFSKGWWPKSVIWADTLWAEELRSDKKKKKNLQAVRMVEDPDKKVNILWTPNGIYNSETEREYTDIWNLPQQKYPFLPYKMPSPMEFNW